MIFELCSHPSTQVNCFFLSQLFQDLFDDLIFCCLSRSNLPSFYFEIWQVHYLFFQITRYTLFICCVIQFTWRQAVYILIECPLILKIHRGFFISHFLKILRIFSLHPLFFQFSPLFFCIKHTVVFSLEFLTPIIQFSKN